MAERKKNGDPCDNGEHCTAAYEPVRLGSLSVVDSKSVHLGNDKLYKGPETQVGQNIRILSGTGTYTIPVGHSPQCLKNHQQYSFWSMIRSFKLTSVLLMMLICVFVYVMGRAFYAMRVNNNGVVNCASSNYLEAGCEYLSNDPDRLRIYKRNVWNALPPVDVVDNIAGPVPDIVITHSATNGCTTRSECSHLIKQFQRLHVDFNGLKDITYNFLVGGDGAVYEGRGWDKMGEFSPTNFSSRAIGICVIGTFTKMVPNFMQLDTTKKLIEFGVTVGKVKPDYNLIAHNKTKCTASPGEMFYSILQTWPHWYDPGSPNCTKSS